MRTTSATAEGDQTEASRPIVRPGIARGLLALIAVMAVALALKAWDDRQRTNTAEIILLQTEAAMIAEQLSGKVATARIAISLAERQETGQSQAASAVPGVDVVLPLSDAMQAPVGSRMRAAADAAVAARTNDRLAALTSTGDILTVGDAAAENPLLALAPSEAWLPRTETGRRLLVHGATTVSTGDPALADSPHEGMRTGSAFGPGLQVHSQACAPVPAGLATVCVRSARPLIALDDIVSLIIYALLFAAPTLAIVSLANRVADKRTFDAAINEQQDQSARLLGLVANGAAIGYWEMLDGFETVELSEKAQGLLGIDLEQPITYQRLLQSVAPEDQDSMVETLSEASASGWVQVRFRVDGMPTERWVEMRGGLSPDANEHAGAPPSAYGGILLDVTQEVLAERRIVAAERRLRGAIENFSGPFALWDRRKRLLYWNQAYAVSFKLEDTLRAGISHDMVTVARTAAIQREQVSEDDTNTTIYALKSGQWIKMVERATSDGGLITVGVDITDNIHSEQQLTRQKQKLHVLVSQLERSEGRAGELARKYGEEKTKAEYASKTKSAFLANMSHELRTPLNAVNGFSEMLVNELYGPLGDPRYKEYANDILTSGQHLLDMINEILDMAKIEAGKMTIDPRPIDPVDPVDAAVRMVRRKADEKDVELTLRHDEDLPEIPADHRAVRQMVLNLVSNAIKFTDSGGSIMVGVHRRDGEVEVSVRDTGIGIPKEDLPRLGQPFEQVEGNTERNLKGTGLGLALTKSFAEMHGGRLTIASAEGKGTLIRFYLPIDNAGHQTSRDVA
ncbi:MAG: PAS domain-containing sensor histidine kinase [Pseudomonadota bacterium]